MLMDEEHCVHTGSVSYALCEMTQFVSIAVNPCFCMCVVVDEVAVLQAFPGVSVSDSGAQEWVLCVEIRGNDVSCMQAQIISSGWLSLGTVCAGLDFIWFERNECGTGARGKWEAVGCGCVQGRHAHMVGWGIRGGRVCSWSAVSWEI